MLKKLKTWIFKKNIEAVIFDYDGVLNDSLINLLKVWNEFYQLGLSNKYFHTKEQFSNHFQGDPKKNLLDVGISEENIPECNRIIRKMLPELDKKVELYPRIDFLVKSLKKEGYKIGIVSNALKHMIEEKLKKYSIDNCVDSIIGYDEVNRPKPFCEGICKCMKDLGVKPSKTIYVGDMEMDVKAAKAANVMMIAAMYGYLNLAKDKEERLKGADIFAYTVDEVYEKIKNA